jgi:hypothetical protein
MRLNNPKPPQAHCPYQCGVPLAIFEPKRRFSTLLSTLFLPNTK